MSRTNDHSRRQQGPAWSRPTPGPLRLIICVATLAMSSVSVAFAGQPPRGPAPLPLDFDVIHGLVSQGGAKPAAGAASQGAATPEDPPTAVSTEPDPTEPVPPPAAPSLTQGQQAASGSAAQTPARPKPSARPPSRMPEPASAAAEGPIAQTPPPSVPGRAAGQPAPMRSDMIGGFTRTDHSAGGPASATSTPRSLPVSQMDLIKRVFAPEQVR